MDFAGLKASLLQQIGRAPSNLCYDLVTAEINESVRLAAMQSVVTFAPEVEYDLPSDFLEAVSVYHENGGCRWPMEAQEPAAFDASWSNIHSPQYYAISNDKMRVNGVRSGGTVNLRYYQRQADFANDTDTNSILTNHPAIYVYGVLGHHAAMTQNTQALSVHFPAYERAVSQAKRADIARRMGGNVAGPRPRVAP